MTTGSHPSPSHALVQADFIAEELVVDRDWAEIPYFRKPWFTVLVFLVFMPAYLLLLWTGDTYYRKQGTVYRTSQKRRIIMTFVVVLATLSVMLRQFH